MSDQASVLRELARNQRLVMPPNALPQAQLIAITSGKGGVGKTHVVVNLALALRLAGKRVAILDADFGLANVDVFLGLTPRFHIGHVIEGIQPLESIIVDGPKGIEIIPASSGIQELTEMRSGQQANLIGQLSAIMGRYDYILIDTAAGISNNVIRFLLLARRVIVVSAPEPTAIVDAYALVKVLFKRDPSKEVYLLVNSVQSESEAKDVHRQLAHVAERFLGQEIQLLGFVPKDQRVPQSIRRQQPVLITHPRTVVSRRFFVIAETLMNQPPVPSRLDPLWQEEV
jgi:flagellar biosynthesis protein FlhG